ncbi:hypothetical protein A2368_02755 [Candidatus Collierbacteria bacterium RIFOXYB1_FULL_49_13]|uniref:Uncharacterized protein n=1 Tax=Candidatus Collierbacteria bacterium RIFOXYB1_FULL_49_13 TaxID=1817728 RepID=A0A1F5FEZ9_9BACT|nr:MAG: hypothetical protein A2368_02755 [Candidatus Collierbacteria bacterium RIFOXYB1_FULL_49_13]
MQELPCKEYEAANGAVLKVYGLETESGNVNGKPVEMMIGTAAMPWVVRFYAGVMQYDFGLPYGAGEIVDTIDGVQAKDLESVLEMMSAHGLDHVFYLGRVTREISMMGTLARRTWNGSGY